MRQLLLLALILCTPLAYAQNVPPIIDVMLGTSVQGRSIEAVRIGTGPRKFVLVGDTHGGPEANTYHLVTQLVDYFRANPGEVPPDMSFYLIPTVNPDGLAGGTRFNAHGVDLNRNMDTSSDTCPENDWQQRVAGAYGLISDTGGPYPESEPESRLIRDFLLDANGVIFFHSNAGVVFPACGDAASATMAQVFAEHAGYEFIPTWDRYPITGGMHDWAGGLGIASMTPELVTGSEPEFEQNLRGVQAVLQQSTSLLPDMVEPMIDGVPVQPVIWRAWMSWGRERIWGKPIHGPQSDGQGGWKQLFENGLLEYNPARSASTNVVQVALLGHEILGDRVVPPEDPAVGGHFFPETSHAIHGLFDQFWQVYGGLPIFGLPLTGEEQSIDEAGQPVIIQTFERAQFILPVDAQGTMDLRLAPLGRLHWIQHDMQTPSSRVRAR